MAWETCKRTRKILIQRGLWEDEEGPAEGPLSERDPGLAGLYQESIRGVISLGKNRGRSIVFYGEPAWDEEDPAIKRTGYGFERCGSRMQLVSFITSPPVIQKILRSVGLPADSPLLRPAQTEELLDPAA